jgi:hypothetical protein
MQLDSHLVEKFHSLHRQRKSGLLRASGDGFALGIQLADGEPVAIDLGMGLEQAFSAACRTYHKLDEAGAAELDAAIAGGAKGRDYLVQRQLISEAEAEQVAQAVVEDAITRCFRGPCTAIDFDDGAAADDLAIGSTAIRMRIGVEQLIRTCAQRVAEQLAVEREIGGWDAVFALSEGGNASGSLGEYEKMVLNFIDGRSSVEQIAELCRDSSMNLGRVLRSLIAKRVIQRVEALRASGVRQAVAAPAPGSGSAAAPAVAAPAEAVRAPGTIDLEVYRARREASTSRPVVLIGLIALLAISVGVGALVINYNSRQEAMRRDELEISGLVAKRQWHQARETVARLRTAAGNDLSGIRVVDTLSGQVEAALTAERAEIGQLIEAEDYATARQRIVLLPDDDGLANRLRDAEAEARQSAQMLAEEIRRRLASGDIAGALAAVDEADGPTARGAAEATLVQWRSEAIGMARTASLPIQARLAALARLRQSRPEPAFEVELAGLERDLATQVGQVGARLAALETDAKAGAWREAAEELDRMRLTDAGAGSDVEERAQRVAAAITASRQRSEGALDAAFAAIAEGSGRERLEVARAGLSATAQALPRASDLALIGAAGEALAALAGTTAVTAGERAAEARTLAGQIAQPRLAEALQARARALGEIEEQASLSLDEARRAGRDGDWNAAVGILERLVRDPRWAGTQVRQAAEVELDAARASAERRVRLREELRAALARGDAAACDAIAREIGLAYLPLVITSVPAGAEVVDGDGAVLGQTPLVLEINADQRVDLQVAIRKTGYDHAQASGANADGGWRIHAELRRVPAASLRLGHPLTARPAVVDGTLWLADRGRAVAFAKPGSEPARRDFAAAATLQQPIFAPVARVGGQLILATREGVALKLDAAAPQRLPLPVASDLPPVVMRSLIVADRTILVCAATDGRIVAVPLGGSEILWQHPRGAPVSAWTLAGEDVLVARGDGRLERIRVEDGRVLGTSSAGGPLAGAWVTATGLSGAARETAWAWNGDALTGERLPEPAAAAADGAMVGSSGRAYQRTDAGGWNEVGRLPARSQPIPITGIVAWDGQVAVVQGRTLTAFGTKPFRIEAESDLLAPVVWGDALVAVSIEGGVWMWRP